MEIVELLFLVDANRCKLPTAGGCSTPSYLAEAPFDGQLSFVWTSSEDDTIVLEPREVK
jgi:hypothetical protein